MSLKHYVLVLVGCLLLPLATPSLLAQVDRAVLEGTVSDPSGAIIPGASVMSLAVETGIKEEQHTNSKGYYRFPGLAVGRYTVTVSDVGFKTHGVEDVILRVGETRTLDVKLEVGTIAEKIDVVATAAPVERSSAEASTVISSNDIANLPNEWTGLGQFHSPRALRPGRRWWRPRNHSLRGSSTGQQRFSD